jgi:phosphoribosylanthranilate isomerase
MCGMTRAEDVAHAINLGVDAIGLIFYLKSPRYITIEPARFLLKNLPPFVSAVAVLVDPEIALVEQILDELPIHLLQFHGDESPEFCQQFDKPYIKAIRPHTADQIKQEMNRYSKAGALLLDTPSDTGKGGTGLTFDWNIIPRDLPKPYILSGGLNQGNVSEAIKIHPYAVDVCSGIEVQPGIKDHLKMSQFIKEARKNNE